MKVLIIEDELPASERLIRMLGHADDTIEVVAQLDTVEKSVAWLKEHEHPDLIFLDIELGDGQSFAIFRQVVVNSPIIFITAFDDHVLRAFKLNSIDYLLKPLKKDELLFALNKFRQIHGTPHSLPDMQKLLEALQGVRPSVEYKDRFLSKTGTRLISVPVEDIAYFYTKDRLQWIKTKGNSDHLIGANLDELEKQVDPKLFYRVNRQFILCYPSIDKVHAWFDGKLKITTLPAAHEEIVVSRLKADNFRVWFGQGEE